MTYKTIMVIAELMERNVKEAKARYEFSCEQMRKFRKENEIGDWEEPKEGELAEEWERLKKVMECFREDMEKYGYAMDDFEEHDWH